MSFVSTDPVSHKGETDVWLTPLEIVKSAGGDFDLDPCAFKGHNTAKKLIYPPMNGLKEEWYGKVFLNPPYSENDKWMQRFCEHGYGVALLFARTDSKWMQRLLRSADYIQFIKGRISFLRPDLTTKTNAGASSLLIFIGCEPVDPQLGVIK